MSEPTTKYAMLLNALCVMQESPAYAVRKGILEQAEQTIVQLERELAAMTKERDEAKQLTRLVGIQADAQEKELDRVVPLLHASESRYRELLELLQEAYDDWIRLGYGASHEDRARFIDFDTRLRAVLAGERQAADGLPPQIDRLVVQGLEAQASLRSRIKVYLDQFAPHAANRAAASLLREAHELLAASEGRG